ncbi:MAG: P-loop NTPase, partial [Myxococcota bacterium]
MIAVGGAKGGVGKTLLAANLGVYLATLGRRAVVVDADAVGQNAHTFLGVEREDDMAPYLPPGPAFLWSPTFDSVPPPPPQLSEEAGAVQGELLDTPVAGLQLLSAGLDGPAGRPRPSREDLLAQVRALEVEYAVIDLG